MQEYCYRDFDIIDAHTHIYPEKIASKASESIGRFYNMPSHHSGTPEELLKNGSVFGVSRYLVCSVATTPSQVAGINDFIVRTCAEHPEFVGFGTIHPLMENVEEEIDRILALGLRGIKIHPDFQTFNIDSPEAYRVFDAAQGRLPFLIHMGDDRYDYSSPARLARALNDFPKLEVIAAHLGGYRAWAQAAGLLKRPRVRVDTSSSLPLIDKAYALELIHHYGVENCFFGTDYPLWDYAAEVRNFFALDLPYADAAKILGGNFRAYFNL